MSIPMKELQHQLLQAITTGKSSLDNFVEETLAPNRYLTQHQALSIYRRAYVARLIDCLKADFPVLLQFLGEEIFTLFAKSYIDEIPPQSYSLFDLGAQFPNYLHQTSPLDTGRGTPIELKIQATIEIAQLERLLLTISRTKEVPRETQCLPDFENFASLMRLHLEPSSALHLFKSQFKLVPLFELAKNNQKSISYDPEPTLSFISVNKQSFRTQIFEIQEWQFHFLTCLKQMTHGKSPTPLSSILFELRNRYNKTFFEAWLPLWLPVAQARNYLTFTERKYTPENSIVEGYERSTATPITSRT